MKVNELPPKLQTIIEQTEQRLTLPKDYPYQHFFTGKQSDEEVLVVRYTKTPQPEFGGEHFSYTVAIDTGIILGTTWMTQTFERNQPLPSEAEVKTIVQSYLSTLEPGLFENLTNLWIQPHDEVIKIGNETIIITGQKYKCFIQGENSYAWVIVGANKEIITFERGILWEGKRVSEMWLHDVWLETYGC